MNSFVFKYEVYVQIVSADLPSVLTRFAQKGIIIKHLSLSDPLTARFSVTATDVAVIKNICDGSGAEYKFFYLRGLLYRFLCLLKRPVVLSAVCLLVFLTLFLPTRVLFLRIEGNQQVSDKRILEAAQAAGVRFGVSNRSLRSEKIKNKLLSELDRLQWVGLNTAGCVTTIHVTEKDNDNDLHENSGFVSGIVAERDAVITDITVSEGVAMCKPGQAVKKGQLLISGYADLGITLRATGAKGEIYGLTSQHLTGKFLSEFTQKQQLQRVEKNYSLLIGKKLINFNNNSGILPPTCGKMYEQIPLSLADGLQLPVSLLIETQIWYLSEPGSDDGTSAEWLAQNLEQYLLDHSVAGQVVSRQNIIRNDDTLSIDFICREMIGRKTTEEYLVYNGKNS